MPHTDVTVGVVVVPLETPTPLPAAEYPSNGLTPDAGV